MSQCHEETGGTWARGSLEDQISEANLRSGSRPGEVSAPLSASRFYVWRPVSVFLCDASSRSVILEPQEHLDLQANPQLTSVKSQGSLLLCCFHKKKKGCPPASSHLAVSKRARPKFLPALHFLRFLR